MGSTPTIGSNSKPRISFFRGAFINGVCLFKSFLKRAFAFLLTLLITAGSLFACFSTKSLADSPYSISGTAYIKKTGFTIGTNESGILKIGEGGSGRGLQTLNIRLDMHDTTVSGSLQYRIYISKKGWQDWTDSGNTTGLTTMPYLITGIQMRLTGTLADSYSVWYAAYTDRHKDLEGWVSDGAIAGSSSEGRKIEQLKVMLVKRDTTFGYSEISFRSYMQRTGWEKKWKGSNRTTGSAGKNRKLMGFELSLRSNGYSGGIEYRTLIGGGDWQKWMSDGTFSGTTKKGKKIEAIEIRLTGEIANHYDIYYRTYSGGLGWFVWAKNGEASGTRRIGRHIEAIQISLVKKGQGDPGKLGKAKCNIGYKFCSASTHTGVSDWKISPTGRSRGFASAVLRRAKYYNRTEYKDMMCDRLVTQVLTDVLGSQLGKKKGARYPRLNEWMGCSSLEALLTSTFTYKDKEGRLVICRPVTTSKLKKIKKITEADFNEWLTSYCRPGDILIFYNKNKKPIHCGIYSGVQNGSVKDYEHFHGSMKGKKESDTKPGPYIWHSAYTTGVANKYAFWAAEPGKRAMYVKRFRVDSGYSQPPAPKDQ